MSDSGPPYFRLSLRVRLQDDLPQKSTTYRQEAPIAQLAVPVRFCAICSIYITPKGKALGNILTVSIFIGGCVFSFANQACLCRHFALPRCSVGINCRKMAAYTSLVNQSLPINIATAPTSDKLKVKDAVLTWTCTHIV